MTSLFLLGQAIMPGSADEIVNLALKGLLGLCSLLFLWFVRNLPKMSTAMEEFPAQIEALKTDVSSKLDALHTDLRSIEKSLGALAVEQGSSKTRVDGLSDRLARQEARVDGMIERRGSAVQP